MNCSKSFRFRLLLVTLVVTGCQGMVAHAEDTSEGWDFVVSPFTIHYHPSSEHKPVVLAGLTKRLEEHWIASGAVFTNSFGQPSVCLLGGQRFFDPFGWDRGYLQWTAGLMYGYVGQYKDKVPLNHNGFSPGLIPTIGYRFSDSVYGEINLLGDAALMPTLVIPF